MSSSPTKITDIPLPIRPRPLQEAVLNNPSRKQICVAHRRFGKTTVALLKILLNARPNTRFFYIATTYKAAKMIAWDMLLSLIPPAVLRKKNEVELSVELINGCKIELKGGDDSGESLRGVGLDGCVIDEWASQDPILYTQIIRPALADRKGWVLFIGTPKGKNHFFDLYFNTPEEDRYLFRASDTNVISDPELALAKSEMSLEEYNQEFECEFLYFSGQIYKEFKPDRHVIKPFKMVDNAGLIYCSIDYGQVNPTCALWCLVDYDGKVYVIDEHYEAGKTVAHHCEKIKSKGHNMRTLPLLDPSAFARNRSKGDQMWSVADEFTENGLQCTPAQNDVLGGINRVKEYLENNKLFIFSNCEKLIWELSNYRWKDKKNLDTNLPEEPLKVNDHAVDALRYFILSRPHKPTFPKYRPPLEERLHKLKIEKERNRSWY